MRLALIIPTLLAIVSAIGATETTPLQEFSAEMGERLNAAAKAVDAKPDQAAVEAAVARAKQDGVAKLTDAELVLVRGSGAHVVWRRAVAEQQRRSGDAQSAADNDVIADLDAYYRPDAERSASPWKNTGDMMRHLTATATVCSLHSKHDDYGALTDDEVAALDAIRVELRPDVAAAVDAEVMRRPGVQMRIAAARCRAAGDNTTADAWERMAADPEPLRLAITSSATLAREWQGTSALIGLSSDWSGDPRLSLGIAVERLAFDREPVDAAVEAVVRVDFPIGITGRIAVGPALAGRIGSTLDGELVVGLDVGVRAEYAIAYGVAMTIDLGAGQRATESASSDIQPTASVGIVSVF